MSVEYQCRLRDAAGIVVAVFDDWERLYYRNRVNEVGELQFKLAGDDTRRDLFVLDGRLEIWRKDEAANIAWYCDGEFFIREWRRETDVNGVKTFNVTGLALLDLLARRIVLPTAANTDVTSIAAVAGDTALYNLVNNNCGSGAAVARQMSGLSLVTAAGSASAVSRDIRCNENLLLVCRELAVAARKAGTGVDFAVYGIGKDSSLGVAAFKFKTYTPYLGANKIAGQPNGVIFSLGMDNMATPTYTLNRKSEITYVYAAGAGEAANRVVTELSSLAVTDSTWNRRETWLDAFDQSDAAMLTALARAELQTQGAQTALTFKVVESAGSRYGREWGCGDYVTGRYDDQEVNVQIASVAVTFDKNGEKIDVELRNV